MRWSFIFSSTDSMSSRVRFLEPTRPFSIPNMPPKAPVFFELKRNNKVTFLQWAKVNMSYANQVTSSSIFFSKVSFVFFFLLWLACFTDNHSLLFHPVFLTGVIVHRHEVTLHRTRLHALKHTENISKPFNSTWPSPIQLNTFNRIYRITLGLMVSIISRTISIPFTVVQIFGARTTHVPNTHFLFSRLLGLWGFTGSQRPKWKNQK